MNNDGHQVYSKVMEVEPMSLHLTDDTPLIFLDGPTTDYLRLNMGRFIASWVTGDFDDLSTTHHTETGSLILTPVTQRLGQNNWPVLSFFPRNGAGRSDRCTEPFIVSMLNTHDHCFPCRPNSSSVVAGQRWGHVVIFSLAKGFNCMRASRINTFIRNVETGEEFHLAKETPSSGPTMGHSSNETAASIKCHDDADATLLKGTPMYLWQHNECPGRHNQGCFRMSSYQGDIINDSMNLQCQLKDASVCRYTPYKKLKFWTRLTNQGNAHLISIATKRWKPSTMNHDKDCLRNGVPPLVSA